jgi:hypothetical protein
VLPRVRYQQGLFYGAAARRCVGARHNGRLVVLSRE